MTKKLETVQLQTSERYIDWRHLLVLPQMRKNFDPEKVRELAYSIAANGMINSQIVAILPEKEFWSYVDYVSKVWKVSITQEDRARLKKQKHGHNFHVIVAGERRLRALNILWNEGCLACREKNNGKPVTHGKCWKKHFGTEKIKVLVPKTKDHRKLLATQLAENVYDRPLPHEEAEAVAQLTVFMKSEDPKVSYANIAKRIGRTAELVSRSMAFYTLPHSIRLLVREKRIKYGVAVELARLQKEAKYTDEQLLIEANLSVINKQYAKVGEFTKHVSGLILEYQRNQLAGDNLLQMFTQTTPEGRIKAAISPQTVLLARTLVSYFSRAVDLWEHPEMLPVVAGRKLTIGGLIEDYEKIIHMLEKAIPYVEQAVTIEEAVRIRTGIRELKQVVERKRKTLVA